MPGWQNPFPFEVGGEPTSVERAFRFLLEAVGGVGGGGAAEDQDGTIEGLWRQCRGEALGILARYGEHAALQYFAELATEALPYYEDIHALVVTDDQTLEDRRVAAWAADTQVLSSEIPTLSEELLSVDPALSVIALSWSNSDTTVMGRPFEDSTEQFSVVAGGRTLTEFPAYSQAHMVYVLYDTGSTGVLTPTQMAVAERAKELLRKVLPSWCHFAVVTSVGHIAGISPAGFTGAGL